MKPPEIERTAAYPNLKKLLEWELAKNQSLSKATNNLINNLLRICNYSFELKPSPIEKIAKFIGLKPNYKEKELLAKASLFEDGKVIFENPSDKIERRFSLGHEIGHIIVKNLQKINDDYSRKVGITRKRYGPGQWYNEEHFCDKVAREFVCPKYLINNSLRKFLKDNGGLNLDNFDSTHRSLQISSETLTQQLNRTQLLNELKSGVLISGFSVDKYGRGPTKRIFYQALPKYFEPIEYLTSIYDLGLENLARFADDFSQTFKEKGEIKLKLKGDKKELRTFNIYEEDVKFWDSPTQPLPKITTIFKIL